MFLGLVTAEEETVIPTGANRLLFLMAPMLTFALAMIAWAVIPVNNGWAVADINVGVLYLFAISSLGGRCPKKLRSLPFLLGLFAGLSSAFGAEVEAVGASGICTPRPLRMLIELARLNALVPGSGAV